MSTILTNTWYAYSRECKPWEERICLVILRNQGYRLALYHKGNWWTTDRRDILYDVDFFYIFEFLPMAIQKGEARLLHPDEPLYCNIE